MKNCLIALMITMLLLCTTSAIAENKYMFPDRLEIIEDEAFAGNTSIEEVILPDWVTTIGSRAFADSSLTYIWLPESIEYIADDAFEGCSNDLRFEYYTGTYAADWVDWYCDNDPGDDDMTEAPAEDFKYEKKDGEIVITGYKGAGGRVVIPQNIDRYPVTSIQYQAFVLNKTLTEVIIPEGVREIGFDAFGNCDHLQTVVLPSTLKNLGNLVFEGCYGLQQITIPDGITTLGKGLFRDCNIQQIKLPDTLAEIRIYAFQCASTSNLIIPASVSSIAEEAFSRFVGTITFQGSAPTMPDNVFSEAQVVVKYPHDNPSWKSVIQNTYGAAHIRWVPDNWTPNEPIDPPKDATEALTVLETDNESMQKYGVGSTSYLHADQDGGFTRVEYVGTTGHFYDGGTVHIEQYDSAFHLVWKKTIEAELPRWGGFFSGIKYNFLVFGQSNTKEDDSVEVMRVVRYSKNWNRIDDARLLGANTTFPFDAGSLRMAEAGDYLYIHTCHEMYKSDDGKNHQANMSYRIFVPDMDFDQQDYSGGYSGYVSHSFDQFVIVDSGDTIKVDLGDGYPRSVVLAHFRGSADNSARSRNTVVNMLKITGELGDNYTGVSLGGLCASRTHYLVAGNSIDQTQFGSDEQRNIFVASVPKDNLSDDNVTIHWITDYPSASPGSDLLYPAREEWDSEHYVSKPTLVNVTPTRSLLMWTEGSDHVFKYVLLGADGAPVSDIYLNEDISLSDCQPIIIGKEVLWYATKNSKPLFYSIDIKDLTTIWIYPVE